MRRTAGKRRYRNTGPDADTRFAVQSRASWQCEICGGKACWNFDPQLHHRRPRGIGGTRRDDTNQPSNLLWVGADCHRSLESRRSEALVNGWLVGQYANPAHVAVLVNQGSRWVYLTADGRYANNPPETS